MIVLRLQTTLTSCQQLSVHPFEFPEPNKSSTSNKRLVYLSWFESEVRDEIDYSKSSYCCKQF
jgi:hypothetical protein